MSGRLGSTLSNGGKRTGFAAAVVIVLCLCGQGLGPGSAGAANTSASSSTPSNPSGVVWLCRPGVTPDPCTNSLTAISIDGKGRRTLVKAPPTTSPKIDCFYVYPTVSKEKTTNANLTVQPQETGVAIAQASRFSQVCNVYAPMYPQGTLQDIGSSPANTAEETAYDGLIKAWDYYIQYLNDGRGFVIIGHSQGAEVLTKLVQKEIDPNPTLRKRMVSAILLGGNVLVKKGQRTGGDFQHIPTCVSATELHCVIAYSSFYQEPPENSRFGRAEEGPGAVIATLPPKGTPVQVVCVNPAKLLGQSSLESYFPTRSSPAEKALHWWPVVVEPTDWVTYPGLYSAKCMNQGGAQWLDITAHQGTVSRRTVKEIPNKTWGLHLSDPNLELGDLVAVVQDESQSYTGGG